MIQLNTTQIADRHPLKQGLKLLSLIKHASPGWKIADRHPLKQGLKQINFGTDDPIYSNRRPTSTKTRIETYSKWDLVKT